MKRVLAVLVVSLLSAGSSMACQFDTDCSPGSKCLKKKYALYGVCAGGMLPGNDNDNVPVYDPLDPNRTTGKTCMFDVDCGPGSQCFKVGSCPSPQPDSEPTSTGSPGRLGTFLALAAGPRDRPYRAVR